MGIEEITESEAVLFERAKRDIESIGEVSFELRFNKRFGVWIPDISVFQYGKCISIIEVKSKKPSRETILRVINCGRTALRVCEIGCFAIAYPEDDKIVCMDITGAVYSHDRDVAGFIDLVLKQKPQDLKELLGVYCTVSGKTSKPLDGPSKVSIKSVLKMIAWIASIAAAWVAIFFDISKDFSLNWIRLVLILIVLVFSSIFFFQKITINRSGLSIVGLAYDSKQGIDKTEK